MNEGTDNDVMLRVKSGRIEDLTIIFQRHHGQLTGFFQRMTGSRSTAEDLVQEAFMRMLRYRESFRGDGGGFTTWMFSLARRLCKDHLSRSSRLGHMEAATTLDPPSGDPEPYDRLARKQSVEVLRRALLGLDEDKREVLLLRRFHFKKYKEIAEIVGCSEGTARVRAHRAVQELKEIYTRISGEAKP